MGAPLAFVRNPFRIEIVCFLGSNWEVFNKLPYGLEQPKPSSR